jgi:predicted XRE-type DNA-binding protein
MKKQSMANFGVSLPQVEASSGNRFADLGFRTPDFALAKATLVLRRHQLVAVRRLRRGEFAESLEVNQRRVSALVDGQIERHSIKWFLGC